MKLLLRLLLVLLTAQGYLAYGQAAPQFYHAILLDSVGLRFPGNGQLAQPIINPFRSFRRSGGLNQQYPLGADNGTAYCMRWHTAVARLHR